MANLNNQDLAAWLNGKMRPLADVLAGVRQLASTDTTVWTDTMKPIMDAHGDDTALVNDGSEGDGRQQLTITEWKAVVTAFGLIDADIVAGLAAIMKAAVNPHIPGQ